MNRRDLLKGLMAGGVIVAGELWMPGQKLISIPSGNQYSIDSMFRMLDKHTVEYVGGRDKVASVSEFYNWMKKNAGHMMGPQVNPDGLMVTMRDNFRITNPEHLCKGTLEQAAENGHLRELREMWICGSDPKEDTIDSFDRVYFSAGDKPPLGTKRKHIDYPEWTSGDNNRVWVGEAFDRV